MASPGICRHCGHQPVAPGAGVCPQCGKGNPNPKPFWPTREEGRHLLWGCAFFATFFALIFGPIVIGSIVIPLLPSGDGWGIVTARLVLVAAVALAWYRWGKSIVISIPTWFHGRISNELYGLLTRDEPPDEPKSATAAAFKNWQLAAVALAAFCIAYGVVALDNPLLDLDVGPKRTRSLVHMIQWCRGNPNTVVSSSVLVGVAALGRYIFLIRRAAAKPKASLPKTAATKE